MHQGSCLCGAVRYEIEGKLGPIGFCHCSRCRKVNGTAFSTASLIPSENFKIITGEEVLTDYESSPGVHRIFCSVCASPICSRRDEMPESIRLRVGTLDTPVTEKPVMHIFVADKAEWYEICDDIPQYDERP